MTVEAQKLELIKMILSLQDKTLLENIAHIINRKGSGVKTQADSIQKSAGKVESYRKFGFAKDAIKYVAPDFDETPAGFEDYMPSEQQ